MCRANWVYFSNIYGREGKRKKKGKEGERKGKEGAEGRKEAAGREGGDFLRKCRGKSSER